MDKLEYIKKYLEDRKNKKKQMRMQWYLKCAITNNDVKAIKDLFKTGVTLDELEKEDSTLRMALDGFMGKIYNLQHRDMRDKYQDLDAYYHEYDRAQFTDLNKDMQNHIRKYTTDAILMLETLYENGADINHNIHTYFDNSKSYQVEGNSVFDVILASYSFSKQVVFIEWLLSKPNLDLTKAFGKGFITELSNDINPNAIKAVEMLLEKGIPLDEDDPEKVFEIGFHNNSLTALLVREDLPDKVERFKVLWKYATEEQKKQFTSEFDLNLVTQQENTDVKGPKL